MDNQSQNRTVDLNYWLITLIIVLAFISGGTISYFFGPKQIETKTIENTIKQIDTLWKDREAFVDTIEVQKQIVITNYVERTITEDSVFSNGTDSSKIELFNKAYPKNSDTTKLMDITSFQASKAVETKTKFERDSTLLVLEKKNSTNCQTTLDEVKVKTTVIADAYKDSNKQSYRDGLKNGIIGTSVGAIVVGLLISFFN